MKLKKITQVDILYLSISMFIIVVVWIVLSLYHNFVTSTISEDLQMKITPIDGSFDTATIKNIKSRVGVTPVYQLNGGQQASASAQLSPTPGNSNITVTPSAGPLQITGTITPTQAASPTAKPTISP